MGVANRQKRYPFRFEVVYDDGEGFMSGPVVDPSARRGLVVIQPPAAVAESPQSASSAP